MHTFTAEEWVENFRVSKETFVHLCTRLKPVIARQDTRMRRAVSVEHRLAITLWCLATCAEYRTIGHLFGVARSTVCVIVHTSCKAINEVFAKEYISFPTGSELNRVVDGFKDKWDIIQCAGSIDGSHIPVSPPACNHTDYYNRKGWYSVILQAVVDHAYLFHDICVGWPGSVHDARVFANSAVYRKATQGLILNGNSITISQQSVSVYLVGDSAYPLLPWLIKPFAHHAALSSAQKTFNYRVSRARIVVENAFGRLKARWRRLQKQNDMDVTNVPHVVQTCCILHNMCEIKGEGIRDSWLNNSSTLPQPTGGVSTVAPSTRATSIRDALVQYFITH